ncbi:N2,N2-dimethylguanosine tRNA methyltransferase-domain-containing protein [Tirmania nivea]|nr:N2,N2-dimethylguanosine tRNA methyltransferase-domain-containing protein [Tirmania nivea]
MYTEVHRIDNSSTSFSSFPNLFSPRSCIKYIVTQLRLHLRPPWTSRAQHRVRLSQPIRIQFDLPRSLSPQFWTYSSTAIAPAFSLPPGQHHQQLQPSTCTITEMPDTTNPLAGPKPTHSTQVKITEDGGEKEYTAITEGKATILFPGGGEVFYNPIQNFNRDLSVLAIKTFGEGFLREREEGRRRARGGGKGGKDGKAKKQSTMGEGRELKEKEKEELEKDNHDHGENPDAMDVDYSPSSEATPNLEPTPPPFRILDALSATGLRALRYALEIPFTTHLTANDVSPAAVQAIHRNLLYNHPSNPSSIQKITPTTSPAQAHMYSSPHNYHVIDLDPYGTASPFLDSALQAIVTKDSGPGHGTGSGGGLLCVTCTDAGVWASTGYAEKCFALYGGMPIKGDASHEVGLRLIIYSIATTAAKYGFAIEPLLSLSIDFYARVFIRVKKSAAEVKNLASKSMLVYNCDSGCGAWRTVALGRAKTEIGRTGGEFVKYSLAPVPEGEKGCEWCGFREHIGGPMWGGELHEEGFVRKLLEMVEGADEDVYTTLPRIRGMVMTALDECTFAKNPIPVAARGGGEMVDIKEGDAAIAVESLTTIPSNTDTTTPSIIPPVETPAPPTPPYPPLPQPYFFLLPTRLSKTLHSVSPTQASLRGALLSLGYPVGRSHCRPNSIKTTAPWIVVWEVMRQWVERYAPVKIEGLNPKGPGIRVLKGMSGNGKDESGEGGGAREEVRIKVGEVRFDEELGKDRERSRGGKQGGKKEVRYQMNPTWGWGPMKAAKGAPPGLDLQKGREGKRKEVEEQGEAEAEVEAQVREGEGEVGVEKVGKKIKYYDELCGIRIAYGFVGIAPRGPLFCIAALKERKEGSNTSFFEATPPFFLLRSSPILFRPLPTEPKLWQRSGASSLDKKTTTSGSSEKLRVRTEQLQETRMSRPSALPRTPPGTGRAGTRLDEIGEAEEDLYPPLPLGHRRDEGDDSEEYEPYEPDDRETGDEQPQVAPATTRTQTFPPPPKKTNKTTRGPTLENVTSRRPFGGRTTTTQDNPEAQRILTCTGC